MARMLTYNLPDHRFSTERTLGKTATQLYNGPDEIVLHISKETGGIFESFTVDGEHDRPLALDLERVVFKAESDEDYIKIALIYGGLEEPKVYEVQTGPDYHPNITIKDPSDIREVFDEGAVMANYQAPLQFKVLGRDRSDAWLRKIRNQLLAQSDGKISDDMPAELKQKWLDYRQQLRDLPDTLSEVPNDLTRMPRHPNEDYDAWFDNPHVEVIRIADRTAEDLIRLRQLPPGVY